MRSVLMWNVHMQSLCTDNDRWSLLMWRVRTQSCGHFKKKWNIRVATIVSKMNRDPAQQHNSTTAQVEKEQKITIY